MEKTSESPEKQEQILLEKVAKGRKNLQKASQATAMVVNSLLSQHGGLAEEEDLEKWIELYSTHVWVYAGAFAIASTISALDFQLFRFSNGKENEPKQVAKHPILDLLNFPNNQTTKVDMMESLVVYLETGGEAYWEIVYGKIKGKPSSQPAELWSIIPSQITPILGKRGIEKYIFQTKKHAKKLAFSPEQILPFKYFNPLSYTRGQGSLRAAGDDIQLDFNMIKWNKEFFANGTVLDGIFTTEKSLTKRQLEDVKGQIELKVQGDGHHTIVLTNDITYQSIANPPKDSEWQEGHKVNRNSILSAMGVPPIKVGILDQAKYDNYRLQEDSFHRDTIIPKLKKITGAMRLYLLPKFGLDPKEYELRFDTRSLLSEDQDRLTERQIKQVRSGIITPNEARIDLGRDPYEGGEKFYIESSLIPQAGEDFVEANDSEETLMDREDEIVKAVNDLQEKMKGMIREVKEEIKSEIADDRD